MVVFKFSFCIWVSLSTDECVISTFFLSKDQAEKYTKFDKHIQTCVPSLYDCHSFKSSNIEVILTTTGFFFACILKLKICSWDCVCQKILGITCIVNFLPYLRNLVLRIFENDTMVLALILICALTKSNQ